MTEFAIDASVSNTMEYALFELNGGFMPSMIQELRAEEAFYQGVKEFVRMALENLANAHDTIIEACIFQAAYTNRHRTGDLPVAVESLVYLLTQNLSLLKSQVSKLCPKYIGLYKVMTAKPDTSNYVLESPKVLQA